jgi:hypothetical protein
LINPLTSVLPGSSGMTGGPAAEPYRGVGIAFVSGSGDMLRMGHTPTTQENFLTRLLLALGNPAGPNDTDHADEEHWGLEMADASDSNEGRLFGDPGGPEGVASMAFRSSGSASSPSLDPVTTREPPTIASGAARASAAGLASALADPSRPSRTLEGVHPELVQRMERVVERMWSEHGDRVELVEGYRTQDRQDLLYAQGRSREGDVVTWTRNSAHTRGHAVDVMVNGGWTDTEAFRRLHVLAAEEGLRTLGMRDAGHIELSMETAMANPFTPDLPQMIASPAEQEEVAVGSALDGRNAGDGTLSRPWERIAGGRGPDRVLDRAEHATTPVRSSGPSVNGVAAVAQVARVAQVGGGALAAGSHAGGSRVSLRGGAAPLSALTEPQSTSTARAESALTSEEESGTRSRDAEAEEQVRTEAASFIRGPETGSLDSGAALSEPARLGVAERFEALQLAATEASEARSQRIGALGGPGVLAGPSTTERIEQIRALQDSVRAPGVIRVELTNVDGLGTDLRLAMQGRGVTAQIDVADAIRARFLQSRIGELRSALEKQGLEPEALMARLSAVGQDQGPTREATRLESSPSAEGERRDREAEDETPSEGNRNFSQHTSRRNDDQ